MTGARIITTGCKNDAASVVRAGAVVDMLAEANPERTFVDFRRTEEGKSFKGKDIAGLLALVVREKIDIVIVDANLIPLNLQPELEIASIPERGNPFKVLVSSDDLILDEQRDDVPIAVSDPASRGQLLYYRPDLLLVDIEGDFESLISMMDRRQIGGFVTDASEAEALNHQDRVVEVFTSSICMPAAGQGAVGLVTRRTDRKTKQIAGSINHTPSFLEISLERMFLGELSKDGRGPVCVLCNADDDEFQISAVIAAPDGSEKISGLMRGWTGEERETSRKLARYLLESGAAHLIRNC